MTETEPEQIPPEPAGRGRRGPVVVTGSHRSGTTWVARTLEKSGVLSYVDEPLNLEYDGGHKIAGIRNWFPYVLPGSSPVVDQLAAIERAAAAQSKRALFKDPIGFFAIPAYVEALHADVVVIVRHPAAFASSLKRLGWRFDFSHLLQQPALIDDLLQPYRRDMEAALSGGKDIVHQAIVLWNAIYHAAAGFRQRYPGIMLARHEDISRRPLEWFGRACNELELPFTDGMRAYILETTAAENPAEAAGNRVHQLARNSIGNIKAFRKRLSAAEMDRIREGTAAVASLFYTEEDW